MFGYYEYSWRDSLLEVRRPLRGMLRATRTITCYHERQRGIPALLCRLLTGKSDNHMMRSTLHLTIEQTTGAAWISRIVFNDLSGVVQQSYPDLIQSDPIRRRFKSGMASGKHVSSTNSVLNVIYIHLSNEQLLFLLASFSTVYHGS